MSLARAEWIGSNNDFLDSYGDLIRFVSIRDVQKFFFLQVQVKSQVFGHESKSSLKSLVMSPSQVSILNK